MNIVESRFPIETPLALPGDEVQLWRVALDAVGGDEDRWKAVLSPDESARATRFRFQRDRQRYVASRALLRMILAGYLAVDPGSVRFIYSAKEKPSLDPMHAGSNIAFNVAHSGGVALLAFTLGRDVGVDVEQIRDDFELEGIARRYFSPREQEQLAALPEVGKAEAFFRCWSRKEAYIKATGDGLSLPLSQFDVSLASGEMNGLLATRPDAAEAGRWRLQEVPAGPGYIAAICVRGQDWKLNDWSAGGRS